MHKMQMQIIRFLFGIFLTLAAGAQSFAQSPASPPAEEGESTPSKPQGNSLIDLEIAARLEARAEALRAKLLELQLQEIYLQACLDDLNYLLTPEGTYKALAFIGSPRPMDEYREALRIKVETEKARVSKQLELIASSRERVNNSIGEVNTALERVHQRLGLP